MMPELPGEDRFEQQEDQDRVEHRPVQLAAAADRGGIPRQLLPVGQDGRR